MTKKLFKGTHLIGRVLAVVMAVTLSFAMAINVSAASANKDVNDARNGVVQIQVWFVDPETTKNEALWTGTGFLINESTVVTCNHVVDVSDEEFKNWLDDLNAETKVQRTVEQVKKLLEIRIMVLRDVYIKATVKKASAEMDYAILTLSETMKNRTPLKIRDSSNLEQTEEVFALGFPGDMSYFKETNYYDTEDVTITSGNVNKVDNMDFYTYDDNGKVTGHYKNVNCVESSALIAGGNSGGSLVDSNGCVVGINAAGNSTRNFAISSKQLIDVLDALGIKYTSADSSVPVIGDGTESGVEKLDTSKLSALLATANDKESAEYTEESFKALKDAIKSANSALTSDSQIDIDNAVADLQDAIDALEEKGTSAVDKYALIGIIAVVAVIIIGVVVVLIIVLSKKNKTPVAAPQTPKAVAPVVAKPATPVTPAAPVAPAPVQAPVSNETTVLNQGAGETTVLNQGAGETTVLSQVVNGGSLTRSSNNERIPINSADFTIGRERSKVDYCVGGNTNISRIHARFVVKDGKTYIVDNKAANGTFVNGVKARAGQEIELNNGDKILLADEKFEFNK